MCEKIEYVCNQNSVETMDLRREEPVRAEDIKISRQEKKAEKIWSFLQQTGNPYVVRVGEYVVQMKFSEGGQGLVEKKTMNDCARLFWKRKGGE